MKMLIFAVVMISHVVFMNCAVQAATGKTPKLRVLQGGDFRVIYHSEGPLALSREDVNNNGIPDQAEDILLHFAATRMLFCELLGFPDPLHSERFSKVRFIDIRLDRPKGGSTSSKIHFPTDIPGSPPDAGSLVIRNSIIFDPRSKPSHEFFHLIQYAATYCRAGWFVEGTADWSNGQRTMCSDAKMLKARRWHEARPFEQWPLPASETAKLFEMEYEAARFFWNRLARLCDSDGEIPRGPAFEKLLRLRYTDGSPVLKDTRLVGWRLMRDVLLELGKIDGDTSLRKDNMAILRAVERAAERHLPPSKKKQDVL